MFLLFVIFRWFFRRTAVAISVMVFYELLSV